VVRYTELVIENIVAIIGGLLIASGGAFMGLAPPFVVVNILGWMICACGVVITGIGFSLFKGMRWLI